MKPKYQHTKESGVALLNELWRYFGGPAVLSDLLEVSPQMIVNWRTRGKIPLKRVNIIASKLGVPKWGLNYKDLAYSELDNVPAWASVVKSYKLSKEAIKTILEKAKV